MGTECTERVQVLLLLTRFPMCVCVCDQARGKTRVQEKTLPTKMHNFPGIFFTPGGIQPGYFDVEFLRAKNLTIRSNWTGVSRIRRVRSGRTAAVCGLSGIVTWSDVARLAHAIGRGLVLGAIPKRTTGPRAVVVR